MLISCGDPAKGPATYTRFILPFAYCPTSYKADSSSKTSSNKLVYEEKLTDDLTWHDLKTMSLKITDAIPIKESRSVIVAKIKNSYHIRIFDEAGKIVIDKAENEFLPDSTLVQKLDAALNLQLNNKQIGKDIKHELIKKIESNLDNANLIWRKKYLTYETSDVLFKRAKWFTLKDDQYPLEIDMNFRDCGKNDYITVGIKTPELILFEWPQAKHNKKCFKSLNNPCKDTCKKPSSTQCLEDEHNILRTGFLVIELYFSEHSHRPPCLDNLLELNELFRYWQQPFTGHEDMGYKKLLGNLPFTHNSEAHDSEKKISDKNNPLDLYFKRWASLLETPIIRDKQGSEWRLFPKKWAEHARKFVSGENSIDPGWAIYPDNRTFVWTCAIMKDGGNRLRAEFNEEKGKASDFGHWIKLLNVDKPARYVYTSNNHTQFEKEWAEKRTYKRWEEGGTFYGFNYHSGAMLGPSEGLPLWQHFGQMYFDQILLLLYIRVELFRFSMRLNKISETALKRESSDYTQWLEESQKFRESFTLFTNLYQFPFLSNQQQAIEMYSLARKHMDIDDLFKEIQQEVNSNHEYLSTKEATKQTDTTTRLTVVATIGLILAITTGFFGMNIIVEDELKGHFSWHAVSDWGALIGTTLVFLIGTLFVIRSSVWIGDYFDKLSNRKCFSRKSRKP